jgi:DNA-directed RNA polymerase subunit RPC12/RpoP
MGRRMSLLKCKFRTVQEAEQVAFRLMLTGLFAVGLGLILVLSPLARPLGVMSLVTGGLVILGDIGWFSLLTKYHTLSKACPRCGKPNPIFQDERHFKCVSCGHVVILREF